MARWLFIAILLTVILVVAIFTSSMLEEEVVPVRAATTTSLYNTGLLDYLAEKYMEANPSVRIDFIAVGSGEALRRAEMGDACLVLVHAPSLERVYIEKGVLLDGAIFAYNYFIIVGPSKDPAGVRGSGSAVEAFKKIYMFGERGMVKFISRGDNSGTHVRERMIWSMAGLRPGGDWYLESGQGMAQTLIMASELRAYTLSDIGTYLSLKSEGRLDGMDILYTNSSELINIYSIYYTSACREGERDAAMDFIAFITSSQELITEYDRIVGGPLFHPASDMDWLRMEWRRLAGYQG